MSSNRRKKRVEFRSNRQKRARRNDLTRQVHSEAEVAEDLVSGERVSGKGELSRHRTVLGDDEGGGLRRDVDESLCLPGRVLSSAGQYSLVQTEDGVFRECTVRRVLRTLSRDGRNVVVTGDRVLVRPQEVAGDATPQGVVERVEPRTGTLSRTSQHREHVIAANIEQALIVVSTDDPPLKPRLIDRFLVSAERGGVAGIVCINKADLADRLDLQPLIGRYTALEYRAVLTSTVTGFGIAHLRQLLAGRTTVVSGQSGVGKSSLLNAVQPGLSLPTAAVSNWTQKGRHTTRRAVMHPLLSGGWVIDTPGIRQLELWDVRPEELEAWFPEFRPFVPRCRFPDCTHTHEGDCGVLAAVSSGLISLERYHSYCRLLAGDMD